MGIIGIEPSSSPSLDGQSVGPVTLRSAHSGIRRRHYLCEVRNNRSRCSQDLHFVWGSTAPVKVAVHKSDYTLISVDPVSLYNSAHSQFHNLLNRFMM